MARTAKAKRGRPRPQEVIDRDEKVYEAIPADGATRDEIADETGYELSEVYLSLFRLKRDGWVERVPNEDGGFTRVWVRT